MKIIKLIIYGLIFSILFMTGCSKEISAKTIKTLKFENIKAARIELARTGGSPTKNYTFDFNNPDHVKLLKDIVNSLNTGKVQGEADERISNKGSSPTVLILELKNGSIIQIKAAVENKTTKLSHGSTEVSQIDIPGEIIISTNTNEKPIRMLSPEIRKLIDNKVKI
ncbi:MAG: hypothetical protein Q8936_16445 [Bacillota bacterium]|nr:hypothetical protein [Bacillota bacterium]